MATNGDQTPKGGFDWSRGISAGSQMVVLLLVGFFIGRWLDGAWGTEPWLTVVGIFLGFGVGLVRAYRLLVEP